jgi:Mg2+ and Co2+ transporter CorA
MTIAAEEMAVTGVRQNDDMRKISAWVAIVAVPTGVTGFFGQNVPYPGYGDTTGFVASLVVMVLLAGLLYTIFKSKRWL